MKILSSAGNWGYGPCSKLVMIAEQLQDVINIDFCGESIALAFAEKNAHSFKNIFHSNSLPSVTERYDAVISVMNPTVIAWGYLKKIPIFTIDSLHWFWQWPLDKQIIAEKQTMSVVAEGNFEQLLGFLNTLPIYLDYHTLYSLSTITFAQRYAISVNKNGLHTRAKVIEIDPIVDRRFFNKGSHDTILISFSGMINPIVTRQNRITYFKLVQRLLIPLLNTVSQKFQIVCAVPESTIEDATSIFDRNDISLRSLSHEEMLTTINRSIVVIAPPGITTIYECLAYEIPILFLPEQHDGHFPNYDLLARFSGSVSNFRQIFPEALIGYRDNNDSPGIQALYNRYEQLISTNSNKILEEMESSLSLGLQKILDNSEDQTLAYKQCGMLKPLIGTFAGIKQITDKILAELEPVIL